MGEINGPNFGVNQVNFQGVKKSQAEVPEESTEKELPQLKDFSNPKGESLGCAQVQVNSQIQFRGLDDNTDADLKALLENPQIAENSDKAFETAYKALQDAGVQHPYEQASEFATVKVK